jgi:starch synthase
MHIVFAASECVPYVRTGGLADVIGELPREVVRQGHEVTVYLPLYRQVQPHLKKRNVAIRSLTIPFEDYNRFVTIVDGGKQQGVQYYFVDCPDLFDREGLYGTPSGDYPDNAERFGLFCRAVLEASKQLGVPDVFHVHDWSSSMVSVYLRTVYSADPALRTAATVLTIHNVGYQGNFTSSTTSHLLLPWDVFSMEKLELYGNFSFLKGGIVYSDAITTVSWKHAEEIKTPEFGDRLDGVLRQRAGDLHGILNGVDYTKWDPATDGNIAGHYTAENFLGKAECRRDLLYAFSANHVPDDAPVLGIVSRFATEKGFDLVAQVVERLVAENAFVVALGTGEPYYENLLRSLQEKFPNAIAVRVTYDEALTHKILAGSDILLMPSKHEPGGLNQMYGLRYGTVPVVHAIGGLDDTVEEWNPDSGTGTGFKFSAYSADDFHAAIERALGAFQNKDAWTTLMRNGMAQDFSWPRPAAEYVALYEEVARKRS